MAFDITNPATGERINSFEEMSASEVQSILELSAMRSGNGRQHHLQSVRG